MSKREIIILLLGMIISIIIMEVCEYVYTVRVSGTCDNYKIIEGNYKVVPMQSPVDKVGDNE